MKKVKMLFFAVAFMFVLISVVNVTAKSATDIQLRMNDFQNGEMLLKGTTSLVKSGLDKGFLKLTQAQSYVIGSAFTPNPLKVTGNRSFSAYFTMKINDTGQKGADGIVFVLSDYPYVSGKNGGNLGYLGLRNSIAIEFDTFANSAIFGDADANHISINANGDLSKPIAVTASGALDKEGIILDDGTLRHVWIEYNGDSKSIEVRIADKAKRPTAPILKANGLNIASVMKESAIHVGFTSATGQYYASHLIGKFYFDNRYYDQGIPLDFQENPVQIATSNSQPGNTKPEVIAGEWTNITGERLISGAISALDVNKDVLKYFITQLPKHGTLQLNNNTGAFLYRAKHKFEGVDTFLVTVSDGKLLSNPVSQTINVTNANHSPTLSPLSLSVIAGSEVRGTIKGNDRNEDPIRYVVDSKPTKGTISLEETSGDFVYTANVEATGEELIYVSADDGIALSVPTTVCIQILPQPVMAVGSVEQLESGKIFEDEFPYAPSMKLRNSLKFAIAESVQHGTFTLNNNGGYRYVSDKGFIGTDRFTFAVIDGSMQSEPAEIVLNVSPPPRVAYMFGYKDGLFKPQQAITRGELAAAIVRLTGIQSRTAFSFSDVNSQHWMYRDIVSVHANRLMTADLKQRFFANRAITRMEMRAIVQRLVQQKHISANSMKSASKEVPWLTVDPAFSKKKEVIKVTRLETVKIMNRLFERKLSTNQVSDRVIWKDVPTEHSNYKEIMRAVE